MRRAIQALSGASGIWRNRELRRAELGWGAAIVAEWMHFVALGVFAYEAGGPLAVGIAGLIRLLPAALLAPFAAALGDRFRRERFLVANALVGAAALAGSAAAFALGGSEILVIGLAAPVGVASTLVRPALQALLPSLARNPAELIASNSATSTVEGLGTLLGPLAAGLIFSLADAGVVFAAGALAFAAAAVLFATVRVEGRLMLSDPKPANARRMLLAGFATVVGEPKSRLVVALIAAQGFVRGCLNVLIVVTVFEVLDAGEGAVGYLTAALGVGGLVGALASPALVGRRLAAPFGLALVFWGLPIALVAPSRYLAVAILLLAIVGAANSIEDVAAFTLLQRIVPDEVLTRVLGVVWAIAMGAVGVGSIAAPAVVDAIGARPSLIVVGAILPVLTLITWRGLVEIDRTVASPGAELEVVEQTSLFAPLSVAAKERLAAALVRQDVAAEEVVFRAGEAGDRFYLVADGALEIVGEGVQAIAASGDFFGEIALLRDVPRTATVHALVDSELYVLSRADFLAAMLAHTGVRAAGEAVADERLEASRKVDQPT
jgi:MFS family permease